MKKWNMILLALMLLALPATGFAQDLPDFLSAVYTGVEEGLEQGAMQALAAMDQELTLEMIPSSMRIEEGLPVTLTIRAGNPRPQPANVAFTLDLPERLKASGDTAWEAELPGAELDPQTGMLVPSETVFTHELALVSGGTSEAAEITGEMSMGTRFYRAKTGLALCVPDVSVKADMVDVNDGRVQPGDSFTYQVEIANAGAASKDVEIELLLPEGVESAQLLPEGFERKENTLVGRVLAQAAGEEPSSVLLSFPVIVSKDVLSGDKDARRLLIGTLLVDGKREALPRAEVCGAKISAVLLPEKESLEEGEAAKLSVVVVNSGLAAADVKLSCVLPQGLTLHREDEEKPDKAVLPPEDPQMPVGEAIPAVMAQEAAATLENRTLVFDVHMEAATERQDGVITNTQVLEIPVKANAPQDNLSEVLMGATLAWSVDNAPVQLGEAVAMRVYRNEFLGIAKEEWNGLFWASVLLLAAVGCLYAAAKRDAKVEDFCCE